MDATISATEAFEVGRFGPKVDPRGAQVVLERSTGNLLGDVVGAYREEVTGVIRLRVRHFNGENWPMDPAMSAIRVMLRR